MSKTSLLTLQESIRSELFENVLPYWFRLKNGESLFPALDNENRVIPGVDLGVVMVSRLLWTYSRAYKLYGKAEFLAMAEHARRVLLTHFHDKEHGGFYWSVHPGGTIVDRKKQCYAQAFCIYAFSEHFDASKSQESLEIAYSLFQKIEENAWDSNTGGYLDSFDTDWSPLDKMGLGDFDSGAPKTMNTHLHLVEAFANLQKVAPRPDVEASCKRILRTIVDRIILPDTPRFGLFYDMDWQLLDDVVSPGHDIEGSWLLYEAAEILGDSELQDELRQKALEMAELVLSTGIDPADSGIYDEFHPTNPRSNTKSWWPQAEGIVGFFNAYQISGDVRFLQASTSLWNLIQNKFVNRDHGEWFWGIYSDGSLIPKEKAGPWKSSYHNSRACFEMIERLDKMLQRASVSSVL